MEKVDEGSPRSEDDLCGSQFSDFITYSPSGDLTGVRSVTPPLEGASGPDTLSDQLLSSPTLFRDGYEFPSSGPPGDCCGLGLPALNNRTGPPAPGAADTREGLIRYAGGEHGVATTHEAGTAEIDPALLAVYLPEVQQTVQGASQHGATYVAGSRSLGKPFDADAAMVPNFPQLEATIGPGEYLGVQPGRPAASVTSRTSVSCSVCGKEYKRSSECKRHQKRTHDLKEAPKCKCDWVGCNRRFWERKDLMRHLRMHLNRRDEECEFCQKKFTRNDNLKRHLRNTHGVQS